MRRGQEAYIKEAGESCVRGEDPLLFGMKIAKQGGRSRGLHTGLAEGGTHFTMGR